MYTERTREDIHADMLEVVRADVDKREGSVVHDMLMPPAEEFEMLGFIMEAILENGFMDTAQAQYVDLRAAERGMYRKESVVSKGWFNIQDRVDTIIEIGTEIVAQFNGELIPFEVTDYAVVPESGEVMVAAIARVGGYIGNVDSYSELTSVDLPDAIITNPIEFLGGVDIESDDELKARYLLAVRKPITSGNIYHYQQWALEVEGISQARVQPLWNGNGTVKIIVIDKDGRAPTVEQVQAVQEHIDRPDKKPIGATVTVVAITEIPINITATLVLTEGLISEDVKKDVEKNVANYLSEATTNIRYSQIAAAILETEGVRDYSGLSIGTGSILNADNITISDEDVAVVGEVILNDPS